MQDFQSPEDLFKEHKKKIQEAGGDVSKYVPLGMIIIAAIIFLQTAVYSIGPDQVGVVKRFGRYVRMTDPGLHLKMPLGIEEVTPVSVRKIYKEEFGFRTTRPGTRTAYSPRQYPDESLMLTGDLNILDVQWIVQFRINDPIKFLFETADPFENVRAMSEVVLRRLAGNYTVDEVLTTERREVALAAQELLQDRMNRYQTGITIEMVNLLDVNPPTEVQPAFNEVNQARQERERMINEAYGEYNRVIPQALGEAERTIRQAEGYGIDRINRAEGESGRFLVTWEAYRLAPEVTRKRLYLESMSRVLPKLERKYIVDPGQRSILPFLNLDHPEGVR